MQDFIIMTRKASYQFRSILKRPLAEERDLRRILLGCLKRSSVLENTSPSLIHESTHLVEIHTPEVKDKVIITIKHNENKRSPDGTMICAFVTDIQPLSTYSGSVA